MVGVDFVINALLEISGFRRGGDCATAIVGAVNNTAMTKKSAGFTCATVM